MDKIKIISNRLGVCPYCNSERIEYEPAKNEVDMMYYPCTCRNCKKYFEEWYSLRFAGHNVGCYGQYDADEYLNEEINYYE